MEIEKKKKKKTKPKKLVKKCPTQKDIEKCVVKIKKLKPEQKACKDLQKIGKKDVDTITELIKKWQKQKVGKKYCKQSKGETKLHYVSRLAYHFGKKLKGLKKKITELIKKKHGGKKLKKNCDTIKHYARKIIVKTCDKIKTENYACQCS